MISSMGEGQEGQGRQGMKQGAGMMDETRETLCPACAAVCSRLVGIEATEWVVRSRSAKVVGVMRWSPYEAISAGTEALEMVVAQVPLAAVRQDSQTARCAWLTCPLCPVPD